VGFIITPYYIPDLFAASLTGLAKYFNPSMQIFWVIIFESQKYVIF
jgi:hypothetical protein